MQIIGKVIAQLPVQSGEGKNGPWSKGGIVIEEDVEKYPKKIAFEAWNDVVDVCQRLSTGTKVRVNFEVESREYQQKWYTNAKAFKIEVNQNGNWIIPEGLYDPKASTPAPKVEAAKNQVNTTEDDLPF